MPAEHQHADTTATARQTSLSVGASAILVGTIAHPGVADRTLIEGYITQPMAMASLGLLERRILIDATLNFEGITLERGELNAGMYGEGYVDRRHPHTWLHELVITGFIGSRRQASITAGKGFIPFGTDDPMSRPFVKYPVNHHLAQLLERAGIIAAASAGSFSLEAAAFNGDEPESPSDMPDLGHIGDSWAVRATGRPSPAIEAQASFASVESPEIAEGGGLDHRKWSASVRYEHAGRYALAEWARTSERDRGVTAFSFSSILAEATIPVRRVNLSFRAERTERPEEERLINVFRTPRPHTDLNILGRTRWDVLSVAAETKLGAFAPFVEVGTQRPKALENPTAFDPRGFYGVNRLWSVSIGIRAGIGMSHSRMGRYGVSTTHAHH